MIQQAFNPLGATGLSNPDQLTCAFADLVTRAAQWGADRELEACCSLLELSDKNVREFLQSARRLKPQSLKEQALEELSELSPAAQAVLDAWESKLEPMVTCLTHDPEREAIAAALRAAADQVVPASPDMIPSLMMVRYRLLAIADELEAQ